MGLTEKGYKRRTFEEILNAKIARAKELFGEDINTESNTPLGKYIRINAYDQYDVEEEMEKVYYSAFPQYATGQTLNRIAWTVGMTRNVATPALYHVKVIGTAGTVIAYGFEVSTETELHFYNTVETVIGNDGTCEIIVECVEAGLIGNVSPSEINQIVNPNADIESVVGLSVEEVGIAEESDYDFRRRYEIVREGKGSCTEAAIISALTNIPTVQGAYIVVNESATDALEGIPPKAIACYIDGGLNYHQEIAEAIFDKKPLGIGTYGDQSATVSYGGLKDYVVNFSHSKAVGVYIKLTLTTSDEFEENGNTDIKANLQAFIDALGIGKPLVTTALYSQIYSVTGVLTALIEVSTDGEAYGTDNIIVEPYECCAFNQLVINNVIV